MSLRILLLLIVAVPALLLGIVVAFGMPVTMAGSGGVPVSRVAIERVGSAAAGLPEVSGPEDPSLPLVVIDAGHGGRDLGAAGSGSDGQRVFEKDIVLAIASALREELLERGNLRVAMTRRDDTIIPLERRPEIARDLGADLFVSIHADSGGLRDDVAGASIYTLSNEASSEAAARFAERENAADRLNGIAIEGQSEEVSAILVELSQQFTQNEAAEFASLIEREGQSRIAFHPQARRSAALAVLRAPDVPSVLLETGFVTNERDRARLTTAQGREEYAQVLARAIRIYFASRPAS